MGGRQKKEHLSFCSLQWEKILQWVSFPFKGCVKRDRLQSKATLPSPTPSRVTPAPVHNTRERTPCTARREGTRPSRTLLPGVGVLCLRKNVKLTAGRQRIRVCFKGLGGEERDAALCKVLLHPGTSR